MPRSCILLWVLALVLSEMFHRGASTAHAQNDRQVDAATVVGQLRPEVARLTQAVLATHPGRPVLEGLDRLSRSVESLQRTLAAGDPKFPDTLMEARRALSALRVSLDLSSAAGADGANLKTLENGLILLESHLGHSSRTPRARDLSESERQQLEALRQNSEKLQVAIQHLRERSRSAPGAGPPPDGKVDHQLATLERLATDVRAASAPGAGATTGGPSATQLVDSILAMNALLGAWSGLKPHLSTADPAAAAAVGQVDSAVSGASVAHDATLEALPAKPAPRPGVLLMIGRSAWRADPAPVDEAHVEAVQTSLRERIRRAAGTASDDGGASVPAAHIPGQTQGGGDGGEDGDDDDADQAGEAVTKGRIIRIVGESADDTR